MIFSALENETVLSLISGGNWEGLATTFAPLGCSNDTTLPLLTVLCKGVPVKTVVILDGSFPAPDSETFVVALVAMFGLLSL